MLGILDVYYVYVNVSFVEPLIKKQWASAFHKTDLDSQLTKLGVDSLVITGLT
ncbi:MAG: isochorismatase family protein, partial [Proteobacteria bacterium]|nr:isochorismatase family protein [Pseudomonadota bacterium]